MMEECQQQMNSSLFFIITKQLFHHATTIFKIRNKLIHSFIHSSTKKEIRKNKEKFVVFGHEIITLLFY